MRIKATVRASPPDPATRLAEQLDASNAGSLLHRKVSDWDLRTAALALGADSTTNGADMINAYEKQTMGKTERRLDSKALWRLGHLLNPVSLPLLNALKIDNYLELAEECTCPITSAMRSSKLFYNKSRSKKGPGLAGEFSELCEEGGREQFWIFM